MAWTLLLAAAAGCAAGPDPTGPDDRSSSWAALGLGDDPWLGDPAAPVVIAELGAPKCGSCAAFHHARLPDLQAEWIDPGHAVLVFVQSTIGYAFDHAGGVAMECVYREGGNAAFWDFVARVYDEQSSFRQDTVHAWLDDAAATHSLDAGALRACYDGRETVDRVDDDWALLDAYGAGQTPIFFVFADGPWVRTDAAGLDAALADVA